METFLKLIGWREGPESVPLFKLPFPLMLAVVTIAIVVGVLLYRVI